MFIQIVQGRSTRADEVHELLERWMRDLAPAADGWLGSTYGFTDDGLFVSVVRFESPDAARANSARPEQTAWAEQLIELFDGPLEFHDCADVTVMLDGGSDQAGFVQVIRGRVQDAARLKAIMTDARMLHEARPEILGATLAIEADGTCTETVAFSDEASARRGEQVAMPDDVREALESSMDDISFLDLHHPQFASKG